MNGQIAWVLPASTPSLAAALPAGPMGTIFVLSGYGGFAATPQVRSRSGVFTLLFGRERDDVHVVIGADDPHISRIHGRLSLLGGEWWMHNSGRLPLHLPAGRLLSGQQMPVPNGYFPVLIGHHEQSRQLLEIRVASPVGPRPPVGPGRATMAPTTYELNEIEQLVIVSLAQRYLRNEDYPQPMSWQEVTDDMRRLMPETPWNSRTTANVVAKVRERLSSGNNPIEGLRANEFGQPLGNTLNHNLILALLETTTLLPEDLGLLKLETDGISSSP